MTPKAATPAPGKKTSRFAVFLAVLALVAAAFGGGALWGHLRARADREAWQKQRDELEQRIASQEREASAARARDAIHGLDEGLSRVLINLAEKNYGLARDEASALSRALADLGGSPAATAGLPEEFRARLASVEPLLAEVTRAADALSPDARASALRARDMLRQLAAQTVP